MKYQVALLIDVRAKPYMIIETNLTSDGYRSRICDGRWETEGEAQAEATYRLERRDPVKPAITPHWEKYNPWDDRVIYVPIEELAECHSSLGKNIRVNNGDFRLCTKEVVLEHWRLAGNQLDAYILVNDTDHIGGITGGIRYGTKGYEYLSPGFNLDKLWELAKKYQKEAQP